MDTLKETYECLAMKRLGKPDTGNPSVRFDEGSESDGHWRKPFIPSAPAYSTTGFGKLVRLGRDRCRAACIPSRGRLAVRSFSAFPVPNRDTTPRFLS